MPVFKLLFLLFLLVPVLEIYLLLQVGGLIGVAPTVGLIVLTAALGALLIRVQGLHTLAVIQTKLQQQEMPALELIAGLMLLICAALLLTPGFFTDGIGFLVLIPGIRHWLASRVLQYLAKRQEDGTIIIEGEYREVK
ncbi:MAG: FxsA family protein, partial [Gammaproteobacteria bacterium]